MATTPKRDAIQKAVVTLKDVKLMTSANAFVFVIEETNTICQIDKDGKDVFTDAFSKPFNCILSTFKSNLAPMKKLRRKVCNNPMGFRGVEEPMFMILDELTSQKIEITRHFGHMGDIVNGFELPKDKWVTDTITLVDEKEASKAFDDDFTEDFKECLNQIERDDDF